MKSIVFSSIFLCLLSVTLMGQPYGPSRQDFPIPRETPATNAQTKSNEKVGQKKGLLKTSTSKAKPNLKASSKKAIVKSGPKKGVLKKVATIQLKNKPLAASKPAQSKQRPGGTHSSTSSPTGSPRSAATHSADKLRSPGSALKEHPVASSKAPLPGSISTPPTTQQTAPSTPVSSPAKTTSELTPSGPVGTSQGQPATSGTQNPAGIPSPVKPPTTPTIKKISNVFTDADIKTVIQEMASSSGAAIIADTSVKGLEISIEFKRDTVESALEKLAYATGVLWKKKGDIYLVSLALPDSPLFSEFAETKVYTPQTQPAENLFGLLMRNFLTYAQLDKAANMISVTAPPRQMDAIWKALTAADSPRKQFAVEAMVTEMNDETIKSAGFSWNWKHFSQGSDLSMTYATATQNDIATLKAMITNHTADLRANPKLVAQEGHEATLSVGTESYFAMVTGNAQYQTVQYQKVAAGITLKFTGFIEPDGVVNLHLQPEVGDAVVLVNGNPQTTIRRADTFIRVRFGDTVALGGLIVGTTNNQVTKVPFLGDLPLIGHIFRTTNKDKTSREVVILIAPRMIQDSVKPTGN